jgi:hypothetical protein
VANDLTLWSLLKEGGLKIDTGLSEDPESPVAVRTVIQIDGDSTVTIDCAVVGPLSAIDRLALAERHRTAVEDGLSQITAGFGQGLQVLRGTVLIGAAAGELYALAPAVEQGMSLLTVDWLTIGLEQLPLAALLASFRLLPRLLRLFQRSSLASDQARRVISRDVYDRMTKGEVVLK